MNTYHVDATKEKLGAASWRIGLPFPRGGRIVLPQERFNAGSWAAVKMDGVATADRGGNAAGIFTYGLTGCFCTVLVRLRNGVAQRAVLNHYTLRPRWKDIIAQFNAGGATGPMEGDTAYMILAEAGTGGTAGGVRDWIADAGLYVPRSHTYVYARSVNTPVSFGVSLERYAGEVPSAAVAQLPGLTREA